MNFFAIAPYLDIFSFIVQVINFDVNKSFGDQLERELIMFGN
jgi:hypothetical protein